MGSIARRLAELEKRLKPRDDAPITKVYISVGDEFRGPDSWPHFGPDTRTDAEKGYRGLTAEEARAYGIPEIPSHVTVVEGHLPGAFTMRLTNSDEEE